MKANKDIVVVKYGSTSVTTKERGMDTERLRVYTPQIARLALNHEVVMVSSGSTVTGRASRDGKKPLSRKGNYAAVGSARAFIAWQDELATRGIESAQVPVTNHEIDSKEGTALRRSLMSLMEDEVIPIANGNDVLSNEGIKELEIDTDNDRLAGHIAQLLGARHLVLLTDREGVLDPAKAVVPTVGPDNIALIRSFIEEGGAGEGAGRGMHSKVDVSYAAAQLPQQGTYAHIAQAGTDLQAVLDGQVGTHFPPHS
jgi:glutamate 5-kinase